MARRGACHRLLAVRADAEDKKGQEIRGIESPKLPFDSSLGEYRFQYVSSFGIYSEETKLVDWSYPSLKEHGR